MQDIIDLLKVIAGIAVIVIVADYWLNQGLPPRGRGRWRDVLRDFQAPRWKRPPD
jgi:hypothetical protein